MKTHALLPLVFALLVFNALQAAPKSKSADISYASQNDIAYYSDAALEKADDYQRAQCKLDIYHPSGRTGFPTVIWFHGGGLTGGKRSMPSGFKNQGIAIVSVSYRLSPQGKLPCFFEDAAAATAWVFQNIANYGGDPSQIYISGHSAGGYLAAMVGMDARWLKPHGISNQQLAGIIPVSAQVTTHFEVKKLRGDTGEQYRPIIDEYAPLYHAAKNLPPICLITGDRRIEFKSRVEENELLAVSLKNLGHEQTEFYEMGGLDHGGVAEGGILVARKFMKKLSAAKNKPAAASDTAAAQPARSYSQLWGRNGELWTPESRLPDFSFAGYQRGEKPIPSPAVTHNIRDFGAKGDGIADDSAAFKKAVTSVQRGVILIPAGRYIITDIIEITKPGVILRGEDRDRTVLYFPKPLNDIRPNWGATTTGDRTSNYSWSGGFIWVKGSLGLAKLADIVAPAPRGARQLALSTTAGIKPGDTIAIRQKDTAENSLARHLYSEEQADMKNLKGSTTTSLPARVAAVNGNTITIDRALRTEVRGEWSPIVSTHKPTVSEVGIENITFEFPAIPYGGHFTELGNNPVALSGVAHCWIRNIKILNCDSGPMLSCDFCTVDGIVYETQRAPDKRRNGRGHHGTIVSGNDNLFTRFEINQQFEHDLTAGACSSGNVFSVGRGEDLCFDHHKRAPYENLFTDIDIGEGTHAWRCGGGKELGWNTGARETFWNIRSKRMLDQPPARFGPRTMNFVALATDKPSETPADGRWFESLNPAEITPQNLHAAQRQKRLVAE